ncbi:MAG: hypothetical protein NW226_13085 [Microscillaceae bacterium]|nr:hypothetical protein [Microscillaceae bacterium]
MKTVEESLTRVIQNTGTVGHQKKIRPLSLFEVAEDISFLKEVLGGIRYVSERVSLSAGMLNRFLKVFELDEEVLEMVKNREIDSIAIVNSLATFQKDDQIYLANLVLNKELNSQDLRALSPFRKQFQSDTIHDVVQHFKKTKNIKVSVINFHTEDLHKDKATLKVDLSELIGESEIVDISFFQEIGSIKITKKGEQILRIKAKESRQSLQKFTYSLLQE